jgi:hypothetical protein
MKRILLITGIVILSLVVVSVAAIVVLGVSTSHTFSSANTSLGYAGAPAMAPQVQDESYFAVSNNGQRSPGAAGATGSGDGAPGANRLVIQNADLTIVVKDPEAKMQAIVNLATTMGGYVVSSNMSESITPDGTKIPQGSIVVRIPVAKLDEALKQIKSDTIDVQNENRSGQDVTKEYTDLQSQLNNLNATEQQLTLIMQKADKTEDVLAIFTQLTQIRGQIEVIKGQIQYYEQSAALSAVSVTLLAQQSTQPIRVAGWEPQGQARDAIQALVNFFQGFVNFLIWLVLMVIPALVLVLLPIYLVFLLVRAIVRRNRAKKPAAE